MILDPSESTPDPTRSVYWGEPSRLDTLNRVILAIFIITLAASCLLVSAQRGTEIGHRAWEPNSMLRVVAEFLAFDYRYPTQRGVEVKRLVLGLGAVAVLLAGVVTWYMRDPRDEEDLSGFVAGTPSADVSKRRGIFTEITPVGGAQMMLLLFTVWALSSTAWARWPEAAFGGGVRQLILTVWALSLARTLGRRGVRAAAGAMVVVLGVTAGLGIWYFYVRNPEQRLKFPIGNPIFLAACLVPGITLACSSLIGTLLEAAGNRSRREGIAFPATRGGRARDLRRVGWGVALIVISLALFWAFDLTGSRGPMVGLIVGVGFALVVSLVVAAYVLTPPRRRLPVLGGLAVIILCAGLAAVLTGLHWLQSQQLIEEGGRGATVRLRFHSWGYARDMFLDHPVIGHGQSSYPLAAQGMSCDDAERDPAAFPAATRGHAHNEWLQILAELGAIGAALYVAALGLTIWGAVLALRRATGWADRCCLVGLLAALVALVTEEAFDVALRKPGLPVIFYAVWGLTWSLSRGILSEAHETRRCSRPVRLAALAGAVVLSATLAWSAWRDWEGALASCRIFEHIDRQEWVEGLGAAEVARQHCLAVDDALIGEDLGNLVAFRAAAWQVDRCRQMVERMDEKRATSNAAVAQLAREDGARFAFYAGLCEQTGLRLLTHMPAYPLIARRLGEIQLLRQEMEALEYQLGLREGVGFYLPAARRWMWQEYVWDRLNADNVVRLLRLLSLPGFGLRPECEDGLRNATVTPELRKGFAHGGIELSPNASVSVEQAGQQWLITDTNQWYPVVKRANEIAVFDVQVADRLDILRTALRQTTRYDDAHEGLVAALTGMVREPGFDVAMDRLFEAAVAVSDGSGSWPDPYVPETFRLAALTRMMFGRFAEAADLAEAAASLAEHLRSRFPRAVAAARIEKAFYLLLAYPDDASRAVEAGRQAIDSWPPVRQREAELEPLRQSLVVYLLAAGDENAADEITRKLYPQGSSDDQRLRRGEGFATLCEIFILLSPDARPARFGQWLERSLALAPRSALTLQIAIHVALERGDDDAAMEYLEAMQQVVIDRQQWAGYIRGLLSRFPDSAVLEEYIAARAKTLPAATQSTTTPATTPGPSAPR